MILPVLLVTTLFHVVSYSQSEELSDKYFAQGKSFYEQNKYVEAAQMFEKAIEAEKVGSKPRLSSLGNEYGWVGYCYQKFGKYDKALEYYLQALEIDKRLGAEAGVAIRLSNIGMVYKSWGKYDKALEYYLQALEIGKRLGDEAGVAIRLSNIGMVYKSWGKYDKALEYYLQALEIGKRLGDEAGVATYLNNIGLVYDSWGKYDKALEYYLQALEIDKRLGAEAEVAIDLNNIGNVYDSWGKYDKALEYYLQALEIGKRLGAEANVATYLNNIGLVYKSWGKYDKALEYYLQALEIGKRLGVEAGVAICLNNIGSLYHTLHKDTLAIPFLTQSVALLEKLRKTATGDVRRDYLESQIGTYQWLISSHIRRSNNAGAFGVCELSRAKLLAEQLAGGEIDSLPVSIMQKALAPGIAVLAFANASWWNNKAILVLTANTVSGIEISDTAFTNNITKRYKAIIDMILQSEKEIADLTKERAGAGIAKPSSLGNAEEKSDFDKVISLYRALLTAPANAAVRGMKATGIPFTTEAQIRELSQGLYRLLIKPVEQQFSGKTHLIIIPDGPLGFIPFETLIDDSGKYLGEKYHITYSQSLTVQKSISTRTYSADRKPMLAFGGAVYDSLRYREDIISNSSQLAYLSRQTNESISTRGSTRSAYVSLGKAQWENLPMTLAEVTALRGLVKDARVITGNSVTENVVKSFSQSGELEKYKVLHFATHGIVVQQMPELSALVLSQFKEELDGEDGYLRMGEIVKLKLNADFVNLSACETGLGRLYTGEGIVGLTQAFLLAGANGLSVSLWQVADESTAKFMVEMYKEAQKNGGDYGRAITDIKRRFIKGEFGEKYKHPFYWAPFVYYGKTSENNSINTSIEPDNQPTQSAVEQTDIRDNSDMNRPGIKTGTAVTITIYSGKQFTGKLVEDSPNNYVLDISGNRITFSKGSVKNISQ
jgi:CHAT domain-containing protein/tetratricopeptide (TPR) repeat protein